MIPLRSTLLQSSRLLLQREQDALETVQPFILPAEFALKWRLEATVALLRVPALYGSRVSELVETQMAGDTAFSELRAPKLDVVGDPLSSTSTHASIDLLEFRQHPF